jgi:ribosome-associated protein
MIEIVPGVVLDEAELTFEVARSSGPGGQNVNKVNTRVCVLFDIERSRALDDVQRERIRSKLGSRLTTEGVLRVTSQVERSQLANKARAVARLVELLRAALTVQRARHATRPTRASREKRLDEKKHKAKLKRERQRGWE